MELAYMTRRIHTSIALNSKLDCWVPKAKVSWNEYGKSHQHMLNGPNDSLCCRDGASVDRDGQTPA